MKIITALFAVTLMLAGCSVIKSRPAEPPDKQSLTTETEAYGKVKPDQSNDEVPFPYNPAMTHFLIAGEPPMYARSYSYPPCNGCWCPDFLGGATPVCCNDPWSWPPKQCPPYTPCRK
jgi:hypothetical protein